jgi:hypothetical protein
MGRTLLLWPHIGPDTLPLTKVARDQVTTDFMLECYSSKCTFMEFTIIRLPTQTVYTDELLTFCCNNAPLSTT